MEQIDVTAVRGYCRITKEFVSSLLIRHLRCTRCGYHCTKENVVAVSVFIGNDLPRVCIRNKL